MSRAAIVAALEALAAGDLLEVEQILRGALEDFPRPKPHRCSCGNSYEWPGLLAAHQQRCVHIEDAAA